jgi:serine/threonine protein kinase
VVLTASGAARTTAAEHVVAAQLVGARARRATEAAPAGARSGAQRRSAIRRRRRLMTGARITETRTGSIETGVVVDRFRMERVLDTRPDTYTMVEARGPYGERVALTLLAPALVADRQVRRSVLGLARLRASIDHPNLVEFRGAVESEDGIYFVSGLPAPRTLETRLSGGHLAADETLRLLGHVAGALDTAAGRGLKHRDLTPRAIVIDEREDGVRGLLTHFGIAVPPTPGCELLGYGDAAAYRSPEELRGAAATPESNVYSLACILVRCLTGSVPYPYERPLLALHAHMVEPPPRLSDRRSELPEELDAVVARAMAKDPGERFASPAQLVWEAARVLGVQVAVPVIAPPPEPRGRLRPTGGSHGIARRARRIPALAGVALLASVVGGFAAGAADWSDDARRKPVVAARAAPDRPEKLAYTQEVSTAVERLRARRVAARKRLRKAQRPAGQATAAGALATAYRDARRALPDRLPSDQAALGDDLLAAERAYRRLSRAATGGNRRAWQVARRDALRREQALRRQLRGGRRS